MIIRFSMSTPNGRCISRLRLNIVHRAKFIRERNGNISSSYGFSSMAMGCCLYIYSKLIHIYQLIQNLVLIKCRSPVMAMSLTTLLDNAVLANPNAKPPILS